MSSPTPPTVGRDSPPSDKLGHSARFPEQPFHFPDDVNDDGRDKGSWETRWPEEARKAIRQEAIFVGLVMLFVLVALIFTWRGDVYSLLAIGCGKCSEQKFSLFAYIFFGGMLGGTLYGIKYLYRVVARGYWNADRKLWRYFSPFLSGGLALAIGALLDSGLLGVSPRTESSTYYFSIGFIAGYFADRALGKLQEIATTIFGSTERHTN